MDQITRTAVLNTKSKSDSDCTFFNFIEKPNSNTLFKITENRTTMEESQLTLEWYPKKLRIKLVCRGNEIIESGAHE